MQQAVVVLVSGEKAASAPQKDGAAVRDSQLSSVKNPGSRPGFPQTEHGSKKRRRDPCFGSWFRIK